MVFLLLGKGKAGNQAQEVLKGGPLPHSSWVFCVSAFYFLECVIALTQGLCTYYSICLDRPLQPYVLDAYLSLNSQFKPHFLWKAL